MPPTPQHLMTMEVLDNIIIVIQPILSGLVDYAGHAVNPAPIIRSIYNETVVQLPEVVTSVRFGATPSFSGGHNILRQDDDNGVFECGFLARDSRFVFDVFGRNDGERHLLVDALMSGIVSGYAVDTNGIVYDEMIVEQLAGQGIIFKGFQEPTWEESDPRAPRPDNQPFAATVILSADIWIYWTIPMFGGFPSFLIGTTVTPGDIQDAGPTPVQNPLNQPASPNGKVLWQPVLNPLYNV